MRNSGASESPVVSMSRKSSSLASSSSRRASSPRRCCRCVPGRRRCWKRRRTAPASCTASSARRSSSHACRPQGEGAMAPGIASASATGSRERVCSSRATVRGNCRCSMAPGVGAAGRGEGGGSAAAVFAGRGARCLRSLRRTSSSSPSAGRCWSGVRFSASIRAKRSSDLAMRPHCASRRRLVVHLFAMYPRRAFRGGPLP